MISEVQISYILALIKYKNFGRAAAACYVTQPTLSMQIKKVEESVGRTIIDRDSSPISLTPFGEHILPFFRRIQSEYDYLAIEIEKLKGTYQSEVRVGIIPTVANYLVPEIYKSWYKKKEEVQLDFIELTTENLLLAVKEKEVDFGIMAGPIHDVAFEQQILFNEEIYIYAPQLKINTLSISELESLQPWLLNEGNCLRTQMINFCNLNKKTVSQWNYEGGHLSVLINMVQQQGGYTLIPANYAVQYNIPKKDLKVLESPTPFRRIVGFNLKRNTKKQMIRQLIQQIQQSNQSTDFDWEKGELLPWDA